MAKLIKSIFGVPAGKIYPRTIAEGEDCPDNLQAYASSIGALEVEDSSEAKKPRETK